MSAENEAIAAIYAADRADGSAIYGVSINLMAVMATYGALVVAAISTDFLEDQWYGPWLHAVVGAPLWGLLCYQYILLSLVDVRVRSIATLERKLLNNIGSTVLSDADKRKVGSDAGDWVSNVVTQPGWLKPANIAAFGGLAVAVVAVAVISLLTVPTTNRAPFVLGVCVHGVLAACFLSAAFYVLLIDVVWQRVTGHPYKSAKIESRHWSP
ncbi:hypothetical protein [Mycobacterium branderi]|uniref:Uncharacterized protein n=1 Tax=Mycobacterium branderi TaxID=43348 RepID=A0A7I7WAV4_9MYCO|nr:hypothetical protein [Mycobacterium branderi]MCV7232736.1 hypothetical protein [Mycobacterium branderi]ORA40876.1 hypothetical protein BST20_01640 [Mycobacterium branderi]BBZ14776.1 hypothetical protein MBRA_49710 [Mycobacterium branderi]